MWGIRVEVRVEASMKRLRHEVQQENTAAKVLHSVGKFGLALEFGRNG